MVVERTADSRAGRVRSTVTAVRVGLDLLAVVTAVAAGAAVVVVALRRLGSQAELEWMEGGMVDQVRRLVSARPVYAEPSLSQTSYLYPPGYLVVAGLASKVFGVSLATLRLVSLLASVSCFPLVG